MGRIRVVCVRISNSGFEVVRDVIKDTIEDAQIFIAANFSRQDKTTSWIFHATE